MLVMVIETEVAVGCLAKYRDEMLVFYDFPAEHLIFFSHYSENSFNLTLRKIGLNCIYSRNENIGEKINEEISFMKSNRCKAIYLFGMSLVAALQTT